MTSVYPEIITKQPDPEEQKQNIDCYRSHTGLEAIRDLDKLYIHQCVEYLEVTQKIEIRNRYRVLDGSGNFLYDAHERYKDDKRGRSSREFVISMFNSEHQEEIRLARESNLDCCGFTCCALSKQCAAELIVEAPVGQRIGSIVQQWGPVRPIFNVLNTEDEVLATVKGPGCRCQNSLCSQPLDFNILTKSGSSQIGCISKLFSGFVRELYTKADDFELSMLADTPLETKILLLSFVFLLDYMYFESETKRPNSHKLGIPSHDT